MNQQYERLPNLNCSRRDFLKLMGLTTAAVSLSPVLSNCASRGTNAYLEQANAIWTQSVKVENASTQPLLELVRLATLAPSGHNTQPWKFAIKEKAIRIFPDVTRRLPVVDPDEREMYISLGAALENLVIAVRAAGYECEVINFPAGEPECLKVVLGRLGNGISDPYYDALTQRQCTRSEYESRSIPASDLQSLESTRVEEGISMSFYTGREEIEKLVEYIAEGDMKQYADEAYVKELVDWIRFNENEAVSSGDGLFSKCSGNPTAPRWLGKLFMNLSSPKSMANKDAKITRSSAGMVIFASERDDKIAWVNMGRVYERFALRATSLNIKNAFMNQPVEAPELRTQLQSAMNLGNAKPQLLARFGYAPAMPRSLRRPLSEVFVS